MSNIHGTELKHCTPPRHSTTHIPSSSAAACFAPAARSSCPDSMAAVAPDGNVSVDIDSDAEADGVALSGAGASAGGGVADEDAVTASEHDALLAEGAAHVAPIMDEDDDDEQLHAR
ncbi:hypothetical protein EON67_09195, partial [archaeon]